MSSFDNYIDSYLGKFLFEDVEIDDAYNLGIFIGKFKPPHKGHFNTLEGLLGEGENVFSTEYPQDIVQCKCDGAIVIISNKSKVEDFNNDGITLEVTPEISEKIWRLFVMDKPYRDRVAFAIDNPVRGAIDILEKISQDGGYDGIPIEKLNIRLFVGEEEGEPGEIDMSATEKEMKRYDYILRNQSNLGFEGDDKVKVCVMARGDSATAVREKIARIAIDKMDLETLSVNIPEHVDISVFWHVVKQSIKG
jgi:hypothetical protein